LPPENGTPENIATAVTDVSERVTQIVRDEIELAKVEVTEKITSLGKGIAAVAAGAVFGSFAVVFFLITLAWALDDVLISGASGIWEGFAIVLGILTLATIGTFFFAWRKLRVGAPTPKMAIDEAKKVRATVAAKSEAEV
jgi:Putative Actinobacterial Holin-X, holin superfamily III